MWSIAWLQSPALQVSKCLCCGRLSCTLHGSRDSSWNEVGTCLSNDILGCFLLSFWLFHVRKLGGLAVLLVAVIWAVVCGGLGNPIYDFRDSVTAALCTVDRTVMFYGLAGASLYEREYFHSYSSISNFLPKEIYHFLTTLSYHRYNFVLNCKCV